ncbi:hypothetical protein VTN31DRAFT_5004 [Thermomyces dupontii]|uniref:uncharacterized protein n=1 Tax=Talaromyces thermophilus TaxID=28565 RepID=UPI0037421525
MATGTTIKLSTADAGVFHHKVRDDAARVGSELLQRDMESHHIFFNEKGFHNHIVHHLLTLFSLGAAPEALQDAYQRGNSYQRPVQPTDRDIVQELLEKKQFKQYLGKEEHYPNFLSYFQREIGAKGVQSVVNEHLFAGDDHADDLLIRMFAGVFHPIIHLGFGIEFNQPAIVAQALAQAAVHKDWPRPFLLGAENAAGGYGLRKGKPLSQLIHEAGQDPTLVESAQWSDDHKILDGTLRRAFNEMCQKASEYTVSEDALPEQVAEMINTNAYITAASQRPTKMIKFDFFLLHSLNCSIYFSAFLSCPWISPKSKARLLEMKSRMDLLNYVSRHAPRLYLNEISDYPIKRNWEELFAAGITDSQDDGHAVKFLRAIANGEQACKPYEDRATQLGFMVQKDMWLKIGNMFIGSISHPGKSSRYINNSGFDESWEEVEGRPRM